MMCIYDDHVKLLILYVDQFHLWYALDYSDNIRWNVSLNDMIGKVGHCSCFLVEDTWLSKVIGLCLVIGLVDLIRTCE